MALQFLQQPETRRHARLISSEKIKQKEGELRVRMLVLHDHSVYNGVRTLTEQLLSSPRLSVHRDNYTKGQPCVHLRTLIFNIQQVVFRKQPKISEVSCSQ
jgi:hypothetical protein